VKSLVRESLVRFGDACEAEELYGVLEECSLAWQDQLVTGEVSLNPVTLRRV
jgi:hypothetical protein